MYDYKAPDTVTRAGRTYGVQPDTGRPGSYSPDPWTEERGGWLEGLALHPLSLVHAIGTQETDSYWSQLLSVTV